MTQVFIMPVSPLTPLSLTAQVNINRLEGGFKELEQEHGFYIDPGTWCCRTCAVHYAWEVGAGKPFVFWHEQDENALHEYPDQPMPLYYGIARKNVNDREIVEVAKKIISVLQKHELPCQWDNQDISKAIFVSLDKHMPIKRDEDDDQEDDHLEVALYLPQNEETEDYCWNESLEEDGEPADSYHFYQEINDRESLKDALLKVEPQIRKYITHYQRCATIDDCIIPSEPIFSIDYRHGHAGAGESLQEALEESDNQTSAIQLITTDKPFEITFDLEGFKELLERGVEMGSRYFFLVKKVGICMYVRSCDFESCVSGLADDFALAADGLDEDFYLSENMEVGSQSYKSEMNRLYTLTNQLYAGDMCEWFALRPEMIDDCDLMIDRGFNKLRVRFESLAIDPTALPATSIEGLLKGDGVIVHNISIRLGGGPCPVSCFRASITIEYANSEKEIPPVKIVDDPDQRLHLSPSEAKRYFAQ